jgi:hypothetical protein
VVAGSSRDTAAGAYNLRWQVCSSADGAMRLGALPVAIVVTAGLQILFYAADLLAATATLAAIMAGCAAYLLVRIRGCA